MYRWQARMAHDTFTLSPRLAPAPSLLPLAQGMGPHPGKEGRHLPCCSARYTQAGPTRAMCPSQKSRCTHAALMDEHKGPHTPRNTLVHPQPPGMPSRMKFLSEQEECADRALSQRADTTGSHLTLPQGPSTGSARHSSPVAPGRHVPLVSTTHIKC